MAAPTRPPPGRVVRTIGKTITKAAVHAPWTWRLLRTPVRRFFDGLAPGWDARVGSGSEQRLAPLDAALAHVEREPARVLDIGTGTGTGAFVLAERYPRAEVVGIDLAPSMIEQARRKAAEVGSNVEFEVADVSSFEGHGAFDLVLMMNMPPFFDQVAALLAPGGHAISISSRGPATPFYTPPATLTRGFEKRGLRTIADETAGPATIHIAERPPA
jgi:SAM-dependent methyltransferase